VQSSAVHSAPNTSAVYELFPDDVLGAIMCFYCCRCYHCYTLLYFVVGLVVLYILWRGHEIPFHSARYLFCDKGVRKSSPPLEHLAVLVSRHKNVFYSAKIESVTASNSILRVLFCEWQVHQNWKITPMKLTEFHPWPRVGFLGDILEFWLDRGHTHESMRIN